MINIFGRGGRWMRAPLGWMRASIDAAPAPTLPWTNPWQCTLAGILLRRPRSPLLTIGPLPLLDRFGALYLDGLHVGFDGDRVEWDKVTSLRTRNARDLLTTDSLEQEVDRIRPLLPPVPGRKKLLTYLAKHLALVLFAALAQGDDALNREIVAEIRYKGPVPGTRQSTRPALFAAALLSLRPDINDALIAEAVRRGLPCKSA